jgi:exonuclease III
MRITTWNARGLNASSKQRLLYHNLKAFESEIILLQETKLNKEEGNKLSNKLKRWNLHMQESRGASGGLGLIWNPRKVLLKVISSSHYWISSYIKGITSNFQFILINVYGPTPNMDKKALWIEISSFMKDYNKELLIIGGDFNTILNLDEKSGGTQQLHPATVEF